MMGVKTIWELCLFQVGPVCLTLEVANGVIWFFFLTERDERVAMATVLRVSFCFFCDAHLCCKFQEHWFNISRDIVYSVFYHFLFANNMTS